jgi:predicted metal-binding protein
MKQETTKNRYDNYIKEAKKRGILDAVIIRPDDIFFDVRANLKCAWGCERLPTANAKCDDRGTTPEQRVAMVKRYEQILLLHSQDSRLLSQTILELERQAFLDGYYFAFALRCCNLCEDCLVENGKECPRPEKVRPCEGLFGIDVYRTVRKLDLPCQVLQTKEELQNRYGFLLIE